MKIVVAQYGKFCTERQRLVDALRRSIEKNAPLCELVIVHPEPEPPGTDRFRPKLRAWNQAIQQATDNLLLLDADCLILGDPRDAFTDDFDIAHSPRPGNYRYNTGAVFVRPTAASRTFGNLWMERTEYWAAPERERRAKAEWGGTDQAAFVDALQLMEHELNVKELAYENWNLCQDFQLMTNDTRILHLKGKIHRACLSGRKNDVHAKAWKHWKRYA